MFDLYFITEKNENMISKAVKKDKSRGKNIKKSDEI